MSRKYRTAARLTIYNQRKTEFFGIPLPNALVIENMRVRFSITKSLEKTPNTCDIIIDNLAESTRVGLRQRPLGVFLDAGYDGVFRRVFTGDVRYDNSELKTPTWETTLQCGDGARAFAGARINRRYKRGTSVVTALKDAAASLGLTLPKEILVNTSRDFGIGSSVHEAITLGMTLEGPVRDELDKLLAPYGYSWSIQDGQLQILRDEDTSRSAGPGFVMADVLSEATGLKESPQITGPTKVGDPPTLRAKCTLSPHLNPGSVVRIAARAVNGNFKIRRVTHTGDTHGTDWTTEIEATPLSRTTP
jgi:hypothetical protein